MTVELNIGRIGVELTYDDEVVQGDTIDVRAENEADGDVSTRSGLKNDGRFVWTYPVGVGVTTTFTVTGSDGGEDTGTITVEESGLVGSPETGTAAGGESGL